MEHIFKKAEQYQQRYIKAEEFLLELYELKWYERIFYRRKIRKFLKENVLKK